MKWERDSPNALSGGKYQFRPRGCPGAPPERPSTASAPTLPHRSAPNRLANSYYRSGLFPVEPSRVSAAPDAELVEDVRHVRLDRPDRDAERGRRLAVGEAIGRHPEDLGLALGEVRKRLARQGDSRGGLDEVGHDLGGELARHRQVPVTGTADGAEQRLGGEVLRQVAGGAEADRLDEIAMLGRHRQHDDLRVGQPWRELLEELQPAHPRQVDVEQDHVGPELDGRLDRSLRRRGLADDLDVGLRDRLPDGVPNEGVVLDEHDCRRRLADSPRSGHPEDHDAAWPGMRNTIFVPSPRRLSMCTSAPMSWARSRIPTMPNVVPSIDVGSKPWPLSEIETSNVERPHTAFTRTTVASACLRTFVSASETIRMSSAPVRDGRDGSAPDVVYSVRIPDRSPKSSTTRSRLSPTVGPSEPLRIVARTALAPPRARSTASPMSVVSSFASTGKSGIWARRAWVSLASH